MKSSATDSDWDTDAFVDDDDSEEATVVEAAVLSRKERLDIRRKLEERLEQKRLKENIGYFDEAWFK